MVCSAVSITLPLLITTACRHRLNTERLAACYLQSKQWCAVGRIVCKPALGLEFDFVLQGNYADIANRNHKKQAYFIAPLSAVDCVLLSHESTGRTNGNGWTDGSARLRFLCVVSSKARALCDLRNFALTALLTKSPPAQTWLILLLFLLLRHLCFCFCSTVVVKRWTFVHCSIQIHKFK